jgi:hypothetical protein
MPVFRLDKGQFMQLTAQGLIFPVQVSVFILQGFTTGKRFPGPVEEIGGYVDKVLQGVHQHCNTGPHMAHVVGAVVEDHETDREYRQQ